MKSKEELDTLKEEVEAVNEKLQELTPEEIAQVSGGLDSASDKGFDFEVDHVGTGGRRRQIGNPYPLS